jgi:uncharacterized protein
MVYIDTSALVPLFVREPGSEAVLGWIESSAETLAISDWSLVEFASALSLKARMGHAEEAFAKRAVARMQAFAAASCLVATPRTEEFRRAAQLCAEASANLRAGDALHLSIAEALKVEGLLCLDAAMCEQARALDINVIEI